MTDMPDEVMRNILRYVSQEDLRSTRYVSRDYRAQSVEALREAKKQRVDMRLLDRINLVAPFYDAFEGLNFCVADRLTGPNRLDTIAELDERIRRLGILHSQTDPEFTWHQRFNTSMYTMGLVKFPYVNVLCYPMNALGIRQFALRRFVRFNRIVVRFASKPHDPGYEHLPESSSQSDPSSNSVFRVDLQALPNVRIDARHRTARIVDPTVRDLLLVTRAFADPHHPYLYSFTVDEVDGRTLHLTCTYSV